MTDNIAIPARFLQPWLEDNSDFIAELAERKRVLVSARSKRGELAIRVMEPGSRCSLAAVDASVADVAIGDLMSILIQVVHVTDDGTTTFGVPIRLTGLGGMELSLARNPTRVAAEYDMLEPSTTTTIADTSFWSGLIDVNLMIGTYFRKGVINREVARAYDRLMTKQCFINTIRNPNVIAMSKQSQSNSIVKKFSDVEVVSDREFLGQALEAGEFIVPARLTETMDAVFGVDKRGFTNAEQKEIRDLYDRQLGVTYFKPHTWSRAFRIEAHLKQLRNDDWLMPLLNAIHFHTLARTAEPWPQFMTDWTSKHIAAVTTLYGELNFHRLPIFDPARTITPKGYR